MQSVLVVDDDPHIREVVVFTLQQAGYATFTAADGIAAIEVHRRHAPDLIVLDILMPELDGLAVCKQLREISQVPIVLLSSRDEEVDRILGLEMGADDYVGKPFSPRELLARIKANLRRTQSNDQQPRILKVDDYVLNPDTYEIRWQDVLLDLTQTEYQLLHTILKRPDSVLSRDALMQGAYDIRRIVSHRTIDSHMRRLRNKLDNRKTPGIRTVHGIGYRLERA